MISYIPTYTSAPMALRDGPEDIGMDVPPDRVAGYLANLPERSNDHVLRPGYRSFTMNEETRNRINNVINTVNSYTFYTGSGLTYSFYLCNHQDRGLIMIYHGIDSMGWYPVTSDDIM